MEHHAPTFSRGVGRLGDRGATAARQFINRDPIGLAGGVDLYAYVGNNGVNISDPMGFATVDQLVHYLQDIANLQKSMTSNNAAISKQSCCPMQAYLKCLVDSLIKELGGDKLTKALADAKDLAETYTKDNDKAQKSIAKYLAGKTGKTAEAIEQIADYAESVGKIAEMLSKVSDIGAELNSGDTLQALLYLGTLTLPSGMNEFLTYYHDAYKNMLEAIADFKYAGGAGSLMGKMDDIIENRNDCAGAIERLTWGGFGTGTGCDSLVQQ